MTQQEKEALLKRIYALPTEWADAGGSYGKGGPVGSEDAAMLWPEDVIDAIKLLAADTNVARSPWVKTSDRLPTEADADNTMCWVLATTISSNLPMPEAIAYIRANPDRYPYWMPIQPLPEVEE